MVKIYTTEYRLTYAEMVKRAAKVDISRNQLNDMMRKLITDGVSSYNTKVLSPVCKFGVDTVELQWQRGLNVEESIATINRYINKAKKTTNVSKWKKLLKVINTCVNQYKNGATQFIINNDKSCYYAVCV